MASVDECHNMRVLLELVGDYNRLPEELYVFEHNT